MSDNPIYSEIERVTLYNQFKILAALYPNEAKDYNELSDILKQGLTNEYRAISSMLESEINLEDSKLVTEVLSIYMWLGESYDNLPPGHSIKESDVQFDGFDGNNEGRLINYTKYLLDTKQLYGGIKIVDSRLNTHTRMKASYHNLIEVYNSLDVGYGRLLAEDEIKKLVDAV